MKRTRPLVEAAKHSVGSTESPEAAKYEMELLLGDYDVYTKRLEELTEKIEVKLEEIPYVDKLLEIKGVGKKIVSGLIAEIGDISRFDNPKQVQKLAGYAIVACSSGKHKGESHISYRAALSLASRQILLTPSAPSITISAGNGHTLSTITPLIALQLR